MASRCRFLPKSATTLIKSSINKPSSLKLNSVVSASPLSNSSSLSQSRSVACRLGSVQSLLPLHSAISSARLTSCLAMDLRSSRSLSQEMGLSVPR